MENQHNTNVAELPIELTRIQSIMAAELEWYKEKHGVMGYYDTFKRSIVKKDVDADRCRLNIDQLWNDIIEELKGHELPSDFQSQNKWINAGNTYRRLPEPLDIANYYRLSNDILDGKPKRHKEKTLISRDQEAAITRLEFSRKRLHPGSFVTINMIYRFWESDGHNFDIKSLDPTKMTQEAYDTLVDIIEFLEISRLHKLFLRAMMILCFIALKIFLDLMVESSESKANIQDIKAKIQDKFNYNGNCNVKIGIIPERSGTPFLKIGVLRPTPMVQKDHSTQLVLRLTGAKLISREYDITSIVSKLSTSEVIVLPRGF